MRAKDFFLQVETAEAELKILNAKVEHYEDIGLNISGGTGAIGSGQKGTSRVELAAVGAADVLTSIEDKRAALLAIIARAEWVIGWIPQIRYREILTYRYLCGKSLKWISDELKYEDPNSVYRAHGWALKEAQRILDQE